MSRKIVAFYNGQCRVCGATLPKGSTCWFRKHYGMRCVSCGPHTSQDTRLPSKSQARPSSPRRPAPPSPEPPAPKYEPLKNHPRFTPLDQRPGFNPDHRAACEDSDGVHRIEYGSVREIVEDALSGYAQNLNNRNVLHALHAQSFSGRDKWANFFTRDRLLDQVFNPPTALTGAVDRMRERLVGELDLPTRPRRKIRRGLDWGDELDADRVFHRDPTPWERIDRAPEPRRTIQIGCNVSVSCRMTPEQLLYRGAAALALADLLTDRGCNVGIALFKCAEGPTDKVKMGVLRCVVKAPDMPLDLSALTFALCEIAFCRCVAVCAGARRWPGRLAGNFGYSRNLPPADREGLDYLIDADVLSESAATEWLRNQMATPSEVETR